MGLRVVAVGEAQFVHKVENATGICEEHGHIGIAAVSGFRNRLDGYREGCYTAVSRLEFRTGRYQDYGYWRDLLAEAVLDVSAEEVNEHPRRYRGQPFVEFIHFPDHAGVFGPRTSAKLAEDFRQRSAEVMARVSAEVGQEEANDWFEQYEKFRNAFELASNNGFVCFE